MPALATRLNPGRPHVVGNLRTLRLAERSDRVLVHDAVDHVLTEADLRAADGTVRTACERHVTGLFPRATSERLLAEAGFRVGAVRESTDEGREPRLFFFGHRPGAG